MKEVAKKEAVNHPPHYKGKTSLECIEVMELIFGKEAVYYFCLCNAFKYLWRYEDKNGVEDVNKSKWYLDYIQHDIDRDGEHNMPIKIINAYDRLKDLYITIGDRIANNN